MITYCGVGNAAASWRLHYPGASHHRTPVGRYTRPVLPACWLWQLSAEERLLALPVPRQRRQRRVGVQGWFTENADPG